MQTIQLGLSLRLQSAVMKSWRCWPVARWEVSVCSSPSDILLYEIHTPQNKDVTAMLELLNIFLTASVRLVKPLEHLHWA